MKRYMMLTALLFLTSCSTFRPMVDMSGKRQSQYNYDIQECQAYAEQVNPGESAIVGAAGGAAVGAILGGIVGAFFGCPGETAAFGAALFGAGGGMQGAGAGARSQKDIIRRCMQGRGWSVLN